MTPDPQPVPDKELGLALELVVMVARDRLSPNELEVVAEASRRLKGEPA